MMRTVGMNKTKEEDTVLYMMRHRGNKSKYAALNRQAVQRAEIGKRMAIGARLVHSSIVCGNQNLLVRVETQSGLVVQAVFAHDAVAWKLPPIGTYILLGGIVTTTKHDNFIALLGETVQVLTPDELTFEPRRPLL